MEQLFFHVLGVVMGVLVTRFILHKQSTYGVIYVNEDDPEYATCGVSFNSSIEDVKSHKYLVLDVQLSRDKQSH